MNMTLPAVLLAACPANADITWTSYESLSLQPDRSSRSAEPCLTTSEIAALKPAMRVREGRCLHAYVVTHYPTYHGSRIILVERPLFASPQGRCLTEAEIAAEIWPEGTLLCLEDDFMGPLVFGDMQNQLSFGASARSEPSLEYSSNLGTLNAPSEYIFGKVAE